MSLNREQTALYQAEIERMHPLMLDRLVANAPTVIDARDQFHDRRLAALEEIYGGAA